MLQQQLEETQTQDTARVRLTTEELMRAIAAVEARKDVDARVNADTMTIGEAIEQLHLDATPEEILAAARENATAQSRTASQTPPTTGSETASQQHTFVETPMFARRRRSLIIPLLTTFLALSGAINLFLLFAAVRVTVPPPAMEAPVAAVAMASEGFPVASLSNNQTAYATLDTLNTLANGANEREATVHSVRNNMVGTEQWPVVRLQGKLYVRGWHAPDGQIVVNGRSITNRNLILSSQTDANQVPWTVPIQEFQKIHDPAYLLTGHWEPGASAIISDGSQTEAVNLAGQEITR